MQFAERKLREKLTKNVETTDEETCSVIAALWLQATTSERIDFTVASSKEGSSMGDTLRSISKDFDGCFSEHKRIRKEHIYKTMLPLARLVFYIGLV